jgi:hypothetical protein
MKESASESGYPRGEDHPEDAGSSTLISRAFVPPCIPAVELQGLPLSDQTSSTKRTGTLDAYY